MAIAVACPHCKQVNKLDDAQKGKETRCVHCRKGFLVKVKPAAEASAPAQEAKVQVKAGPPKPPFRAALESEDLRRGSSRVADDDFEIVEEPPRRRRRERDDDDDDDRPSRRRQGSNAGVIVALLVAGLLLVGGGIFALVWFMLPGEAAPEAEVAVAANPGVAPKVAGDDPLKGIRLQDVVIDPTRPDDFDIMIKLLSSEEEVLRRRAHEWLARANTNHPRRGEVAKLLEGRVQLYINQPFNEHFFDAYFAWATKDNFNWLINMVRDKGPHAGSHRAKALQTLAKLKDERAIPEMVQLLESFFEGDIAFKALAEMGGVAEKNVIGSLNHEEARARDHARKLLQLYETSQDKLLSQTLLDLGSVEERRVGHAMEWLTTAPVDEKRRSEVAKAIDRHLTADGRGFGIRNEHLWTAVRRWGTADNVVRLAQVLEGSRLGNGEVIKALGSIKDPRAAQALAARIGNFFDGKEAQQALQNMGELAEPALIPQLTSQDAKQRASAAQLLAVIGTPKSLQPLTNAARAFNADRDFVREAGNAFQAIKARGK